MISLIAVGQSNYLKEERLVGTNSDIKIIYYTFCDILGHDIKDDTSSTFINLRANEMLAVLENHFSGCQNGDIVIFFYSGHAIESNNQLIFKAIDYNDDDKTGRIFSSDIKNLLIDRNIKLFMILDCCNSGASGHVTNIKACINDPEVFIITSTDMMNLSQDREGGSVFTRVLSESLYELSDRGDEISLNSIGNKLEEKGIKDFQMGSTYGKNNLILKEEHIVDHDFIKAFIDNYSCASEMKYKEMMWYSLSNLPKQDVVSILATYFEGIKHNVCETNWLVRRALGSLLSTVESVLNQKERIIDDLFESNNWMSKCIAIIGTRFNISEKRKLQVINEITNKTNKMDLVWLFHLYYTDNFSFDFDMANKCNLVKTKWGICELYNKFLGTVNHTSLLYEESKMLINEFCENIQTDIEDVEPLIIHNFYNKENKILNMFIKSKSRGRLSKKNNNKWIISLIKGNWRGEFNIDFSNYFENNQMQDIKRDLAEALKVSRPEIIVSLLLYLIKDINLSKRYIDEIMSLLNEEHPWVRIEIVKWIYSSDINKLIQEKGYFYQSKDINQSNYPGTLELYTEELRYDLKKDMNCMSENEKKSVLGYIGKKTSED